MSLDDMLEKIKRIDNGGSGTNIVYFIVAFDLLYCVSSSSTPFNAVFFMK